MKTILSIAFFVAKMIEWIICGFIWPARINYIFFSWRLDQFCVCLLSSFPIPPSLKSCLQQHPPPFYSHSLRFSFNLIASNAEWMPMNKQLFVVISATWFMVHTFIPYAGCLQNLVLFHIYTRA